MKNTKKIITLALAAAMLSATGITAFAAPITANSNPKTGGTTVNYQVAPVYTVVIPESVTLGNTKVTEQIKIYGATANDNVVIGKKQKVNVALTASANDFKVKTADGETIAYTVNDKNAVADLTTVAECTAADGKKDTNITFTKTGTAAYAGTYTDTLTFTVSLADAAVAVTGVTLNKTSLELTAGGDTATLTATVAPDTATDKTVTWESDTPSVATVVDGVVTPVAAGTATITATAGDKSATCTVSVTPANPYAANSVGDVVEFGGYNWYIIGKSEDGVTLLMQNNLMKKAYNDRHTDITWENCSLRSYLNGDFYNSFSADDKAKIAQTHNSNPKNGSTSGGNETDDYIYLLSIGEANALSDTIRANGSDWWLRSPGRISSYAAFVRDGGNVFTTGGYVIGALGVRPALNLKF